jgi:RNA polymerase sigma factor (sigma-70 family)
MSDEEIRADFTRLVTDHKRALVRYSLRRLNDPWACEDVVAETFLIVWRRLDQLPSRDRELLWLYGIAFRVLSNHRRSRGRRDRLHIRLSLERDANENNGVGAINTAPVSLALSGLGASDRELLEFVYWEGLTYREIALVLGISENAVGIRINRAKRNLKALLLQSDNAILDMNILRGEMES